MTRARELADLLTGGQTITTADNNPQLTLESTDADANFGPVLKMHRNSGSPADSDFLGELQLKGENDAGEEILYAQVFGRTGDVTDGTEDGRLATKIMIAGTAQNVLDISSGEIVINDDSVDLDFRVESNGNATMLFVDAGNDKVGVGTNTPAARFSGLSTSGTTTDIGRFEAAVGSYTGTSLVAANTLGAASSYNLFSCITDSDADAGGPVTQFLVRGDGKVGIGTSSPDKQLHIEGSSSTAYSSSDFDQPYNLIKIENTNTSSSMAAGIQFLVGSNGEAAISTTRTGDGAAALCFGTRGGGARTERMRIDSSGNIMMNTTSIGGTSILSLGSSNYMVATHNDGGTSGFFGQIRFRNNANNADVGTINRVNDASVQYNTTSDARLKENVADMTGAIARVKQLSPKRYSWVNEELDAADQDGFLAHEAQAVVPIAVSGTKDEVEVWQEGEDLPDDVSVGDNKLDSDGNTIPVFMQMDYSKLVPLLTGALKEAIAKIETLETKVAALEAE